MATTYAERLEEARVLESSGQGLSVIPLPDRDAVLVRDPTDGAPGDALLPEAARSSVQTWREYVGGAARVAYGL